MEVAHGLTAVLAGVGDEAVPRGQASFAGQVGGGGEDLAKQGRLSSGSGITDVGKVLAGDD